MRTIWHKSVLRTLLVLPLLSSICFASTSTVNVTVNLPASATADFNLSLHKATDGGFVEYNQSQALQYSTSDTETITFAVNDNFEYYFTLTGSRANFEAAGIFGSATFSNDTNRTIVFNGDGSVAYSFLVNGGDWQNTFVPTGGTYDRTYTPHEARNLDVAISFSGQPLDFNDRRLELQILDSSNTYNSFFFDDDVSDGFAPAIENVSISANHFELNDTYPLITTPYPSERIEVLLNDYNQTCNIFKKLLFVDFDTGSWTPSSGLNYSDSRTLATYTAPFDEIGNIGRIYTTSDSTSEQFSSIEYYGNACSGASTETFQTYLESQSIGVDYKTGSPNQIYYLEATNQWATNFSSFTPTNDLTLPAIPSLASSATNPIKIYGSVLFPKSVSNLSSFNLHAINAVNSASLDINSTGTATHVGGNTYTYEIFIADGDSCNNSASNPCRFYIRNEVNSTTNQDLFANADIYGTDDLTNDGNLSFVVKSINEPTYGLTDQPFVEYSVEDDGSGTPLDPIEITSSEDIQIDFTVWEAKDYNATFNFSNLTGELAGYAFRYGIYAYDEDNDAEVEIEYENIIDNVEPVDISGSYDVNFTFPDIGFPSEFDRFIDVFFEKEENITTDWNIDRDTYIDRENYGSYDEAVSDYVRNIDVNITRFDVNMSNLAVLEDLDIRNSSFGKYADLDSDEIGTGVTDYSTSILVNNDGSDIFARARFSDSSPTLYFDRTDIQTIDGLDGGWQESFAEFDINQSIIDLRTIQENLFIYDLPSGWSLISIPVYGDINSTDIDEAFSIMSGVELHRYVPRSFQPWEYWDYPASTPGAGEVRITSLNSREGFWIYLPSAAQVKIPVDDESVYNNENNATAREDVFVFDSLSGEDWAIIGVNEDISPATFVSRFDSAAASDGQAREVRILWEYDPDLSDEWRVYVSENSGISLNSATPTIDMLYRKKGYWLKTQ